MTQPLLALSMPGGPELVFIFVIILLLFGAKKLPELAKGLGRSLGEFKKARDEFEREIHKSTTEVKEDPNKQLHSPDSTGLPAPTPKAPDQEVAK
jgi:sec-independent protein translocase protein TatA